LITDILPIINVKNNTKFISKGDDYLHNTVMNIMYFDCPKVTPFTQTFIIAQNLCVCSKFFL